MNTKSILVYFAPMLFAITSACGGGGGGGGGSGSSSGAGSIQIAETAYDATEGTVVNIRVARSGGSSGVARVDYSSANGTAAAGSDYSAANGTLTWADGISGNRTISIPITDDNSAEGAESFTVTLSNVSGATLGPNSMTTVNIIDNDVASVSAFGPITDLNSATINGIRYRTDASVIYVDGQPANVADLELGQLVSVDGEVNFSEATGVADEINYFSSVIGPVENVDATLQQLIIMGQTVWTNEDTVFDPSIDPATFAGLAPGASARISGYRNAEDEIVATRIGRGSLTAGVQLVGTISGLDLANMLFSVDRLTVDYSNAVLVDLPAGMPANGLRVIVRGSLANGILVVNTIARFDDWAATPGVRAHLSGIITRFASQSDFDLNGVRLTVNAATRFINGIVGDLQANAIITVDGNFGSGTFLANELTFGRPVGGRATSTFEFADFSKVNVHGFSRVTIVQGADYAVEINAPFAIFDDVQATQDGDTVTLGSSRALMLSAYVTMPVLDRVDVAAGSLAHVTLRDFDQERMEVNVGGVSMLRGEGLRVGSLSAKVFGVSVLDFGGIGPIGDAAIDISGVSRATLNMAAGSTLAGAVRTGQGTGVSALYYYGTGVTNDVTLDSVSRLIRLGESRP